MKYVVDVRNVLGASYCTANCANFAPSSMLDDPPKIGIDIFHISDCSVIGAFGENGAIFPSRKLKWDGSTYRRTRRDERWQLRAPASPEWRIDFSNNRSEARVKTLLEFSTLSRAYPHSANIQRIISTYRAHDIQILTLLRCRFDPPATIRSHTEDAFFLVHQPRVKTESMRDVASNDIQSFGRRDRTGTAEFDIHCNAMRLLMKYSNIRVYLATRAARIIASRSVIRAQRRARSAHLNDAARSGSTRLRRNHS